MKDIFKHWREFSRAVRNGKIEITPDGIVFPSQGVIMVNTVDTWINGKDHQVDKNIVPTEGLNQVLLATFCNGTIIGSWYVALFSGNVTPGLTLTGATFVSTCTEFTTYSQSARVLWVPGTPAAGSVDNSASQAVFTISTGGTLYGAALLEASAKSAVTGKVGAAVRFASSRTVVAADVLNVQYTLTATSS